MTNCRRTPPGRWNSSPSPAAEKCSFSTMAVSSTFSRRAENFWPRPWLYCSVSSTGTPTRCAACCSQAVCSAIAALSRITGNRRSWMSMISRVESVALIRLAVLPRGSGFVGADEDGRVDAGIVQAHVPVQMGAGGTPGRADLAEHLASHKLVADLHANFGEMAEHADQPLAVVDENEIGRASCRERVCQYV